MQQVQEKQSDKNAYSKIENNKHTLTEIIVFVEKIKYCRSLTQNTTLFLTAGAKRCSKSKKCTISANIKHKISREHQILAFLLKYSDMPYMLYMCALLAKEKQHGRMMTQKNGVIDIDTNALYLCLF